MTGPVEKSISLTPYEWELVAGVIVDAYDICRDSSASKAGALSSAYSAITGQELTLVTEDEL